MKQLIYEFLSPFHKTYDHQIWQAGTSRGVDTTETSQAGAGDVITSRSRDNLKIYLHYDCLWPPNWQDGNLPEYACAHKVT